MPTILTTKHAFAVALCGAAGLISITTVGLVARYVRLEDDRRSSVLGPEYLVSSGWRANYDRRLARAAWNLVCTTRALPTAATLAEMPNRQVVRLEKRPVKVYGEGMTEIFVKGRQKNSLAFSLAKIPLREAERRCWPPAAVAETTRFSPRPF